MGLLHGTQLDAFNPSLSGITRDPVTRKFKVLVDPAGGLAIAAGGVGVKSGGILSGMLGSGCVLATHVGFIDANVPNTSTIAGATVKDALDNIDTEFADYLKHDGTVPMSGNLSMNSKKITGLADGTSPNDAINLGQLQSAMSLNTIWLHSCAYGDIGAANGCLRPTFVRASQSIKFLLNPSDGDTITLAGASLMFKTSPTLPYHVQRDAGSASNTAANLAAYINATAVISTSPHGQPLNSSIYAIKETTGLGVMVHLVWKGDDLPGYTPSTANNPLLAAYQCATSNPAAISFTTINPGSGSAAFYGAYDSNNDGATVQARYENAVYTYNSDKTDWVLIYANPGSGYFAKVQGDSGGVQTALANALLHMRGDLSTISTVSSYGGSPAGPMITISHRDASSLTALYHSENSIKLLTAYPGVGTLVNDTQNDFNAAADTLLSDLRGTSLRNLLTNGSFIDDPVGISHPLGAPLNAAPCMPGWALYNNDSGIGNVATATWDIAPPGGGLGYSARLDVTGITGVGDNVDFYQPIINEGDYEGRAVTFRALVNANSGVKPYIKTDAGYTDGSAYDIGTGGWQELTVSLVLSAGEKLEEFGVHVYSVDTVYISACTAIAGASYNTLPFIARDYLEDMQMICSMYQKIFWSQHVWVAGGGAGSPGGEVTLTFGASLWRDPVVGDLTFTLTVDPQPNSTPTPDAASLSKHGFTFTLTSGAGAYAANDVVKGYVTVDARPT